jgi:hypothetical protein
MQLFTFEVGSYFSAILSPLPRSKPNARGEDGNKIGYDERLIIPCRQPMGNIWGFVLGFVPPSPIQNVIFTVDKIAPRYFDITATRNAKIVDIPESSGRRIVNKARFSNPGLAF